MKKLLATLILVFGAASCDSPGDATVDPPSELITHVLITLKDSANIQDSVVARFADPDGPTGAGQPVITGVMLNRGHTYFGSIRLLQIRTDRADSVIEITDDVRELNTQHQFFYTPKPPINNNLSVEITDKDDNGLPLGLSFVVRTVEPISGQPLEGMLNVVLSHYEVKGTKNGTTRSDESDVDIDFPITM
jgi:hypothetical protein